MPSFGGESGAVYRPVASTVPKVEFPPATPFTVQFTAVLLLPVTVALNCCVAPAASVAAVGLIVTVIVGVVNVTVAMAVLVVSAWDTAVTVTFAGFGKVVGAV